MSEIEPTKRPKKEVAPRHIAQLVVPVPIGDARGLVHDAVQGTSLMNPFVQVYAGWLAFEPKLRYSQIDETHTRIELDLADNFPGASALGFVQRRGMIDRFFVAIADELARRERWLPHPPANPIER